MGKILDYLNRLKAGATVPMHMPGHKRNAARHYLKDLRADLDITEISGSDNLASPSGMILESEAQAAKLWGARDAFYLVNGSTAGILAGVRALTKDGDKVLLARNSHKAAYNALELCRLEAVYLEPTYAEDQSFFESVCPKDVEAALTENPGIRLVFITSPTYEGVISDIAEISKICHSHGAYLFVDEAHGAHFGLRQSGSGEAGYIFYPSSIDLGADICVKSLHKTLSAHTSTAVLLAAPSFSALSRAELQRYVNMFQTSSPSYILLASIDGLVTELSQGTAGLTKWRDICLDFKSEARSLKRLRLLEPKAGSGNVFEGDISKIVISTAGAGISGSQLSDALRRLGVEVEMAALDYIIAMTGMGETRSSMSRFINALFAIDEELGAQPKEGGAACAQSTTERRLGEVAPESNATVCARLPEVVLMPWQAREKESEWQDLGSAAGRVSAENVWAYPPGIPLIVAGERFDSRLIQKIRAQNEAGVNLESDFGGLPENKIRLIKPLYH